MTREERDKLEAAYETEFRSRFLHFWTEAWSSRKLPPGSVGLVMDASLIDLGKLRKAVFEFLVPKAEPPKLAEPPKPATAVVATKPVNGVTHEPKPNGGARPSQAVPAGTGGKL